ncbi:hypothetical protein FFK22_008780 [Mycobacterium sp. KBS0706]|uniref:hypothetical protein n=1 Tax=Mycobacterium sp. KBS0706 TaxID=2578109 RepID=UPI00110F956D|nr:hypothetical protein [Mycobacterium sp. KBS0706]TSD89067.1 hypothetical protein FFK22_008780 [Mycobacterium sp. KBS0706]
MTLWTWPAELPQRPLVDGYNETLPDLDLVSQPDIGPAMIRRETTAAPYLISLSFKVTDWQKERAKRFYRDDVKGRTTPWWLPEPGVDGYPLLAEDGVTQILDEDDQPILMSSLLLVRFAAQPSFTPLARPKLGWIMPLQLEVLP